MNIFHKEEDKLLTSISIIDNIINYKEFLQEEKIRTRKPCGR